MAAPCKASQVGMLAKPPFIAPPSLMFHVEHQSTHVEASSMLGVAAGGARRGCGRSAWEKSTYVSRETFHDGIANIVRATDAAFKIRGYTGAQSEAMEATGAITRRGHARRSLAGGTRGDRMPSGHHGFHVEHTPTFAEHRRPSLHGAWATELG